MSRGLSGYLDALRVVAALVVLASHLAYPNFTDGVYLFLRELNLGSDAVVVFFVLSGLVIAYASENKDRTAGKFLFNRATRIYSVAIPAVLITIAFDRLGAALYPERYDGWWYNAATIGETLFYGLTFTNEWIGQGFRVGTNGPYWSLSYEVAYYLIFAAWFYGRGVRRVGLIVALCLVVGPKILLLAPAWILGVVTWRSIASGRAASMTISTAWGLALLPLLVYGLALGNDIPGFLLRVTSDMLGLNGGRPFAILNFSDEFIWNALIGLLAAAHIIGVAGIAARRTSTATEPTAIGRTIRWWAGASFSIYLVHYPVLHFLGAALPRDMPMHLRHLGLLVGTLAVCLIAASLFERPLKMWRAMVLQLAAACRARFRRPTPDTPVSTQA